MSDPGTTFADEVQQPPMETDTPIYDQLIREYGGLLIHPMKLTAPQRRRDGKRIRKIQGDVSRET